MTGRVTGKTVVNGVPAVNVMFEHRDKMFDTKILDPYGDFEQGDVVRVSRKDAE